MSSPLLRRDVEVVHYVSETASWIHDRLGEVPRLIRCSLEDEFLELRGYARLPDLFGANVEGNVDVLLQALRYTGVEVPTVALNSFATDLGWVR